MFGESEKKHSIKEKQKNRTYYQGLHIWKNLQGVVHFALNHLLIIAFPFNKSGIHTTMLF